MTGKRGYLFTLLLAIPSLAHAFGLGNIKTHSGLNQPLAAEIDVIATKNEISMGDALIRIGTDAEYEVAGIEKLPVHNKILFDMKRDPDGQMRIYLTTRESVSEPFLNFLVKVDWPNGHIVREYTILLDPPVFAPKTAAPTAIEQPRTTVRMKRPILPRDGLPNAGTPTSTRSVTLTQPRSGVYGPVRTNDTLWDIAVKTRHDKVSTQQMVVALYQNNPQAFNNKNANQLKRGSRLVVPTPADVQKISRREANQWVATLRKTPTRMTTELPVDIQAQSVSADKSAVKATPPSDTTPIHAPQDKLKIVVPKSHLPATTTTPEAAVGDNAPANKLLETEALDAANRTNQELTARLKQLEQQAESLNQLLKLKETELQKLNEQLKTQQQALVESQKKVPAPQGATPQVEPSPKADARPLHLPTELTPTETQGLWLRLLTDKMTLFTGLAIVLVVAGAWLIRRKLAKTDEEATGETTDWENHPLEETFIAPTDPTAARPLSPLADESFKPLPEAEYIALDPVGEVEILVSFGQYAEAERILTSTLETKPNDHRTRVKLLEVYAYTHNKVGFDTQLSQLPPDWQTSTNPLFVKVQTLINETEWPNTTTPASPEPKTLPIEELVEPAAVLPKAPLAAEVQETILKDQSEMPAEIEQDTENLHPHTVPEPERINLGEEVPAPETIIPHLEHLQSEIVEVLATTPESLPPETAKIIQSSQHSESETIEVSSVAPPVENIAPVAPVEESSRVIPWTTTKAIPSETAAAAEPIPTPTTQAVVPEPSSPAATALEHSPAYIKLELARSYLELGDQQEARNMLQEVLTEGSDQQQQDARAMLDTLSA